VTEPTGALAQAKETQKEALQDELGLAQSQLDLDKDELDEANQDLTARHAALAANLDHDKGSIAELAHPIVDAITKQVADATAESARQALPVGSGPAGREDAGAGAAIAHSRIRQQRPAPATAANATISTIFTVVAADRTVFSRSIRRL